MEDKTKVSKTLKWKGELAFEGSVEQFQTFTSELKKYHIGIKVPDVEKFIFDPGSRFGYISPAIKEAVTKMGAKRLDGEHVKFKIIKDIYGGIRTPHLHLGDEIVLFEKEQFKAILGEIARSALEDRVDAGEDYYDMVKPLMVD